MGKSSQGRSIGLIYPHGDTIDASNVFYNQKSVDGIRDLTSVGSFPSNEFGLYDMAGNAWEACWDWHWKNWYYQPESSLPDPIGPDPSNSTHWDQMQADNWMVRTVRGGSRKLRPLPDTGSVEKDFNKTWSQYAISLRPVISAPTTQDAKLFVQASPAQLGSATGGGIYEIGEDATLTAQADTGVNFIRWEDSSGNNLGTSPTLITTISGDSTITAILKKNSETV